MILSLSPPPSYNCIISPPSPKGESIKIVGFDFFFSPSSSSLKGNPCPLFDVKVVRFGTAETSSFHQRQTSSPEPEPCSRREPRPRASCNPLYLAQAGTWPQGCSDFCHIRCWRPKQGGWGCVGLGSPHQLQHWERSPQNGILLQELSGPPER